MKQALPYILKVWLTSALATVTAVNLLKTVQHLSKFYGWYYDLQIIFQHLPTGLVFLGNIVWELLLATSLYLTIIYLNKRAKPINSYKWYLTVGGIMITALPFLYLLIHMLIDGFYKTNNGYYFNAILLNMMTYITIVIVSIWIYKLRIVNDKVINSGP